MIDFRCAFNFSSLGIACNKGSVVSKRWHLADVQSNNICIVADVFSQHQPWADVAVIQEGCDDDSQATPPTFTVQDNHMTEVRVQPGVQTLADITQPFKGRSQMLRPPKVDDLLVIGSL